MNILVQTYVVSGLAAAVSLAAAWSDLKYRRIPNKLTFSNMALGLLLNLCFFGFEGLLDSAAGTAAGFVTIAFYMAGMLGAGDVKLFMAVGALLGWRLVLTSILAAVLFGGSAAAVTLARRKNGRARFAHLYRYIWHTAATHRLAPYEKIDGESDAYFSFGCCIAAGVLLVICLDLSGRLTLVF